MDTTIQNHEHNGIDSKQLTGRVFINAPFDAIADISGSAGATYTSTEQTIINNQTIAINSILSTLRSLQIIRE